MIVYVESPYQLTNAIKLINSKKIEDVSNSNFYFLIRDNGTSNQVRQYQEIIKDKLVSNVCKFIKIERESKAKYHKIIYAIFIISIKIYKTKTLIVGDIRTPVIKPFFLVLNFFKLKVYLVDDGLYLAHDIEKLNGLNINIFTSLPLENKITCNSLKLIKNEIGFFDSYRPGLSKVFIGQNLVEVGFLEEQEYIYRVAQFYNKSFDGIQRALYYPHRYEDVNKLKKIEDLGYEIIFLNKPIEQDFSENGAPDGVFASFYSTALLNLKNMHKCHSFYYLDTDAYLCSHSQREDIKVCQEMMEGAGIRKL